jgi:hypothetical protein
VELPPPAIRIPRERYILEAENAPFETVYETLTAPPVERLRRRYSLDEIRYSPQVRARMPRVDIDTLTFDTGSWEIGPEQAQRLAIIARALKQAIDRNPREVFLIEVTRTRSAQTTRTSPCRSPRGGDRHCAAGHFRRAGREPDDPGLRRAVSQGGE